MKILCPAGILWQTFEELAWQTFEEVALQKNETE